MADAVCGVLHREGHVLLGLRSSHEDSYPECWDLIGGHVEDGESLEAALHRELVEEIGVVPLSSSLVGIIPGSSAPGGFPSTIHVFAVSKWKGDPRIVAREHAELRWFSVAEACALPSLALAAYVPLLRSV